MSSRISSSTSWITPFRNILKLEGSRNFDNSAVVGGLDRFTQRWAEAIGAHFLGSPGSDLAKELLESTYSALSAAQRRQWSGQWLELLEADPPKEADTETTSAAGKSNPPGQESSSRMVMGKLLDVALIS